MKTSGHSEAFIRQAAEQGIRSFDERVKNSKLDKMDPTYQPLFPKAGWRRELRDKEKALKRSNWYKGKDTKDESWTGLPKSRQRRKDFQAEQAQEEEKIHEGWKGNQEVGCCYCRICA